MPACRTTCIDAPRPVPLKSLMFRIVAAGREDATPALDTDQDQVVAVACPAIETANRPWRRVIVHPLQDLFGFCLPVAMRGMSFRK